MKKLLPLVLAVMLVVITAIPTFALADEYTHLVYGDVVFPVLPNDSFAGYYRFIFLDAESGVYYYYSSPKYTVQDDRIVLTKYNEYTYDIMSDTWTFVYYDTGNKDVKYTRFSDGKVTWANFTEGSYFVASDPKVPACDGSTCPATDANADGLCDDCGLSLTYALRGYPSIVGIWNKSVYPYGLVFIRGDGIPSLYFFDNLYATDDGVNLRFNDGNFEVYNLVDGAWVFERTGVGAVDFPDLDSGRIVKVSHDVVYDGSVIQSSDSDFFPTPLWEKMELVTQGEMMGLQATLGGTMTTLVLCGVGCLALLAVLSLFGKRSLIFRS